jgi:hypothetical protein
LEANAEEAKTKEGLQGRVKELGIENDTLRRQDRELEAFKGQRKTSDDVVQNLWNRSRDQGSTRRLGGGEAYTPRYDNDRNSQDDSREDRRRDRQDTSGRRENNTHRPEPRRESDRDQNERRRTSYNDRFDTAQKPLSGPRAKDVEASAVRADRARYGEPHLP